MRTTSRMIKIVRFFLKKLRIHFLHEIASMFEILPYELKLIPYKYEFTMNFSTRILEDLPALNLTSDRA
jgi:hypothetical protein